MAVESGGRRVYRGEGDIRKSHNSEGRDSTSVNSEVFVIQTLSTGFGLGRLKTRQFNKIDQKAQNPQYEQKVQSPPANPAPVRKEQVTEPLGQPSVTTVPAPRSRQLPLLIRVERLLLAYALDSVIVVTTIGVVFVASVLLAAYRHHNGYDIEVLVSSRPVALLLSIRPRDGMLVIIGVQLFYTLAFKLIVGKTLAGGWLRPSINLQLNSKNALSATLPKNSKRV